MEKIDEVKQQLRRQLRAERKEIPQEEKNRLSRELGKRLCQLEQVSPGSGGDASCTGYTVPLDGGAITQP